MPKRVNRMISRWVKPRSAPTLRSLFTWALAFTLCGIAVRTHGVLNVMDQAKLVFGLVHPWNGSKWVGIDTGGSRAG